MRTSAPTTASESTRKGIDLECVDFVAAEDFPSRPHAKKRLSSGACHQTPPATSRRWLGPISFDELQMGVDPSYAADPAGRIYVCRVHQGHISEENIGGQTSTFGPGEMYSPIEIPRNGQVCHASYDVTMFDPDLLNRVATVHGSRSDEVRLLDHRPVSDQAARKLSNAIDYVRTVVNDDVEPTPLVASTTASMLAALMLLTFPTTAASDAQSIDRNDAKPALLRKAVAFIEANVANDISLAHIARDIHVTPRALQYMFRRHLDATPMEYLRRVRLDHAHRELVAADPATDTVQSVALRWGFGHTGRFAELYRQTYHRNPSETLRN